MEVVADTPFKEHLTTLLNGAIGDACIISAEMNEGREVSDEIPGINIGCKKAAEGIPVVVVTRQPAWKLAVFRKFHIIRSYPHVRVIARKVAPAQLLNAITQAESRIGLDDVLARDVLTLPHLQTGVVGEILRREAMASAITDDLELRQQLDAEWMDQAREIFGDLSRAGYVTALGCSLDIDPAYPPLGGKRYADLCCDANTLVSADGQVSDYVGTWLERVSGSMPITVMSPSCKEVSLDKDRLKKAKLAYKVVPHELLRGIHVDQVVSALPADEFFVRTGIRAREYHQVGSLRS